MALLGLCSLFITLCLAHDFDPNTFDSRLSLSPDYELYWSVFPTYIRLGFEVRASWFGFGLSPNGGMGGADIMIARNPGGQIVVTDHFATQESLPPEDIRSFVDWQVVYGNSQGGLIRLIIQRDFDTKDPDDVPITPGDMRIIWATSSVPELVHHDARGSASIRFLGNATEPAPDSFTLFNVQLPLSQVPSSFSGALCSDFALPADDAYNAVMFVPVVNSSLVSSVLAFACDGVRTAPSASSYPCDSPSMAGCQSVFYAWASGGSRLVLPASVGIPIGVGGTKFLTLQVRYARSSLTEDAFDNSGFELYYTADPRPNRAGYLQLGSPAQEIRIPANKSRFAVTNDCTFDGTVNVVASALHMGAHGKEAWSALYRQGQYVTAVGRNLFWNFNLEEYRAVVPEVKLETGDRILTTCVYNTLGVLSEVVGGNSSQQEQCLNFLLVYPQPLNPRCMNGNFSLRRDFEGSYPWAGSLSSGAGGGEEEIDTFQRNVVILNQVVSCFSIAGSMFMIACWFLFRDLRTFAFQLILMMAISDFFNCLGNIFGLPAEGGFCQFQSWIISYFSLASILWTSGVAFTLHMAFVQQREGFAPNHIEAKKKPFHIFCWGVPFVLTVLPACTRSYGRDFAFCWIHQEDATDVAWRFVQFYIPLWIIISYNAYVYVQVFRKLRQMNSPPAILYRLTLYPLVLVICWFPDTLSNIDEAAGLNTHWLNAFAIFFSALNGLLNATVYGLTGDIRSRLCCQPQNTASSVPETPQEPSVTREDL